MSIFKPVTTVTQYNVFTVKQYLRFLKELSLVKEHWNPLHAQRFVRATRNTDPVATIDTTFNRNGRTWCVTVVTDTFIIATAVDAERDARGELVNDYDVIKVML